MQKPYRLANQVLVYCFRLNACGVEYLMLKRTPEYGGFWQGVTGAPENEESLLEGAARELNEETRLSPKELFAVDFNYAFPVEDEWKLAYHTDTLTIREHVFLAKIIGDGDPVLSFEHEAYEWSGFDRAMGLLKWPNNRQALEFCHQLLQGEGAKP